jgi:hypothetical protein
VSQTSRAFPCCGLEIGVELGDFRPRPSPAGAQICQSPPRWDQTSPQRNQDEPDNCQDPTEIRGQERQPSIRKPLPVSTFGALSPLVVKTGCALSPGPPAATLKTLPNCQREQRYIFYITTHCPLPPAAGSGSAELRPMFGTHLLSTPRNLSRRDYRSKPGVAQRTPGRRRARGLYPEGITDCGWGPPPPPAGTPSGFSIELEPVTRGALRDPGL